VRDGGGASPQRRTAPQRAMGAYFQTNWDPTARMHTECRSPLTLGTRVTDARFQLLDKNFNAHLLACWISI